MVRNEDGVVDTGAVTRTPQTGYGSDVNEPLIIAESSEDEGFHVSFPGDCELSSLLQGGEGQVSKGEVEQIVPPSPTSPGARITGFGGGYSETDSSFATTVSPGSSPGFRGGMGGGRGRGRGVPPSSESKIGAAVGVSTTDALSYQGPGSPSPRKSSLSSPRNFDTPKYFDSSPGAKHISFAALSSSGSAADHQPSPTQISPTTQPFTTASSFQDRSPTVARGSQYASCSVPPTVVMQLFDAPAYPLVSIPLNSPLPKEFNAIVVSCVSCTKFNAFPMSFETKQAFKKIVEFGTEVGHMPVRLSEVTTGSRCGLKKDGEMYRVTVERLVQGDGQEVLVSLIDYGGFETVTCDLLVTLSEEVATLPSLRRRCTLLSLVSENSRESAEFLLSLVEYKPIRVKNHGSKSIKGNPVATFTLCDIMSPDGSSNLNEVIAASHFITSSQLKMPAGIVTPEASLMGIKSLQSRSPFTPLAGGQYKIVHYAKKVPFHRPSGNVFEIVPTVVSNPQFIWAQVVHENLQNLHSMQDDMNAIYSKAEGQSAGASAYVPEVGEICAAKYPDDQKFYRAEILCVNHNGTIDVRFLDFGNRETLLISQLHNLQPIFLTLPKQALFFSMKNIVPSGSSTWSDGAVAFLREKIMNRNIKVEIVNGDCTKACFYDPDSPKEILNDTLVKLGLADRSSGTPRPAMSPRSPRSPMPGVNVSHQRRNEGLLQYPVQPPMLNEQRPVGELRLPLDLSHKAPTSLAKDELSSHQKRPVTPPLEPTGDSRQPLLGMMGRKQEEAVPSSFRSVNTARETIAGPERSEAAVKASDLPEDPLDFSPPRLEQDSAATSVPAFQQPLKTVDVSGSVRRVPLLDSTAPRLSPRSSYSTAKKQIGNVKLVEGSEIIAIISHIDNPLSFYIQVVDKSSLGALLECTQKINEIPLAPMTSPKPGDLCICRYSEDSSMYRGRVTNLLPDCKATVQFIDYGNTEVVAIADIHELDEQFLSLPAQAVMCTLNQLLNPSGRNQPWKDDAIEFFRQQVSRSETCTVTLTKVLGLKHVVDVRVSTEDGDSDLLDLLVSAGYGGTISRKKGEESPKKTGAWSPQKSQAGQAGHTHSRSPFAAMQGTKEQGSGTSFQGGLVRAKDQERPQPNSTFPGRSDLVTTSSPSSLSHSVRGEGSGNVQGKKDHPALPGSSKQTRPFGQEGQHKSPFASGREPSRVSAQELGDAADPLTAGEGEKRNQPEPFSAQPKHWPRVTDLPTMEIPSDSEYFEVVVSEVEHPASLYLHIASLPSQQVLSRVTGELNTYFHSTPPTPPTLMQPLAKGTVCCAKFSEDDMWYRAEVLDTPSENNYRVRFLDFGNTETISQPSIAPCPASFLVIPIAAIRCALNGIGPPPQIRQVVSSGGGQRSRAAEAKAFLKEKYSNKRLLAKVVGSRKSEGDGTPGKAKPLLINLVDTSTSEDIDVAGELVKRGLAVYKSQAPANKSMEPSQPPVLSHSVDQSTSKPSLSGPSTSGGSRKEPNTCHAQPPSVVAKTIIPEISLPVPSPSQPLFKVTVTSVSNPGSFWVQQLEQDNLWKLNSLMEELQKAYCDPSKLFPVSPEVGTFCCAKYVADDCWYRAKIVALGGTNTATVCYVDFGNAAEIPTNQLFTLEPQFATLPSLAVHCSLAGLQLARMTSWTSEANEAFLTITQGDGTSQIVLSAKVVQGPGDDGGQTAVELELYLDEQGTLNVATTMAEMGYGTTTATSTQQHVVNGSPESQVVMLDDASPLSLPIPLVKLPSSSEFYVMVTHIETLSTFYFQVANKDEISSLLQLMEEIQTSCRSAEGFTLSRPPKVGELCLALFTDGSWYRAFILQSSKGGQLWKVFFIDFGNALEVDTSQLRPFFDNLFSRPAQAIEAGLYGVPAHEVTSANSTALESFKALVTDAVLLCKVVCNSPLLVELKGVQSGMSVRDDLVQSGLFPRIEDLGVIALPANRLPLQGTSTVVVTDATNPGDFWVQVLDLKAFTELDKLTLKMDEHCKSCGPLQEMPVLGQLCCTQFSEDMAWYRGRVTAVHPDGKLKVHFVDFGNSEYTTLANLRPFKRDFTHVPAQAVHCSLLGFDDGSRVAEYSTTAGKETSELFKSLVGVGINRQLVAMHRGVAGGGCHMTIVELIDTSGSDDVFIHKALQVQ